MLIEMLAKLLSNYRNKYYALVFIKLSVYCLSI